MDCKRYDREFKLNAVKLYRESEKSLHILAKKCIEPFSLS